jgi:hypothetical protein
VTGGACGCRFWDIQQGKYHGKNRAFIDAVVGAGVSLKEKAPYKPPLVKAKAKKGGKA